jgi:GNAT superfamily N-acetyltransferase
MSEKFPEIWEIMLEAFPIEERRTMERQRDLLENPLYRIETIESDGKVAAFLAWWDLVGLCFVEHLAVNKNIRGGGLGSRLISELLRQNSKSAVLEIEPPLDTDQDSIRNKRLRFYEKLGFAAYPYSYAQPSYHEGRSSVDLLLMASSGAEMTHKEFSSFKQTIYRDVYGIYNE